MKNISIKEKNWYSNVMRKIELSSQKNIRDLGGLIGFKGKKVKQGRIYRGGFLGRVNNEDIEIINSLHLTDIIDFRGQNEFINRPDYSFVGVERHNFPMMKEDVQKLKSKTEDSNLLWFIDEGNSGFDHMYNIYKELVLDEVGIDALKKFFRILLDKEDGVFYFHCSQGKDRAGLAAYLLEIALGVDPSVAREDYMLSNEAMKIRIAHYVEDLKDKEFFTEDYHRSLIDVFSTKDEYLDHALEVINENFGSIENYLVNILKVDLEKLRALYLE